ncbi:helix-hairpin-helix domain-containing protein [bacterium]|nr:helix-hairpin-helix domain-containing protein [bacterium]
MNPAKVNRATTTRLTDLPNIGRASAADLVLLGIATPGDLVGRDPYRMFDELCAATGVRQDPCVLDVFISITRFMDGDPPRPWWEYTRERKEELAARRGGSA